MAIRSTWRRIRRRWRYWRNQGERQRLLWEEMEFHLDSMADDLVALGISREEARAAARRKFGNMTRNSEEARSVWIVRWMNDRYAVQRVATRRIA